MTNRTPLPESTPGSNHLMILHLHKGLTDKLDLKLIANGFIIVKTSREHVSITLHMIKYYFS